MNKCCLKSSKYKLIFWVNMLTNFVIGSLKIHSRLGLMAYKTEILENATGSNQNLLMYNMIQQYDFNFCSKDAECISRVVTGLTQNKTNSKYKFI